MFRSHPIIQTFLDLTLGVSIATCAVISLLVYAICTSKITIKKNYEPDNYGRYTYEYSWGDDLMSFLQIYITSHFSPNMNPTLSSFLEHSKNAEN